MYLLMYLNSHSRCVLNCILMCLCVVDNLSGNFILPAEKQLEPIHVLIDCLIADAGKFSE